MSLVLENSVDLTNLGDAIRSKTGGSGLLTVSDMATAINGIAATDTRTWHRAILTTTNSNNTLYSIDLSSYIDNKNDQDYILWLWVAQSPCTDSASYNSYRACGYSKIFERLYYGYASDAGKYWMKSTANKTTLVATDNAMPVFSAYPGGASTYIAVEWDNLILTFKDSRNIKWNNFDPISSQACLFYLA